MTAASPDLSQQSATPAQSERLVSLDALRGFDMFWIVGGDLVAFAVADLLGYGEKPAWLAEQRSHPEWDGFTFYDLIFPLFLFLVGAAMPFSLGKRIERGESKRSIYAKVCRRSLLLIALGILYFNFLELGPFECRYTSVLGRIGLTYFIAAMIMLNTSVRGCIAWIAVFLVGYWAAMLWIPVPGFGAGNLTHGRTLADYIDQHFLPGMLLQGDHDPLGLLSTFPAAANVLIGILAGTWLRHCKAGGGGKTLGMIAAGLGCLAVGYVWAFSFPISKQMWSSSYVMWTAGWSLLLLATFYLLIDVWGLRKCAFPFTVVGVNALTIYIAYHFIDFDAIGALLFGRAPIHPALLPATGFVVAWLCLYVLYRNRVFLKL